MSWRRVAHGSVFVMRPDVSSGPACGVRRSAGDVEAVARRFERDDRSSVAPPAPHPAAAAHAKTISNKVSRGARRAYAETGRWWGMAGDDLTDDTPRGATPRDRRGRQWKRAAVNP